MNTVARHSERGVEDPVKQLRQRYEKLQEILSPYDESFLNDFDKDQSGSRFKNIVRGSLVRIIEYWHNATKEPAYKQISYFLTQESDQFKTYFTANFLDQKDVTYETFFHTYIEGFLLRSLFDGDEECPLNSPDIQILEDQGSFTQFREISDALKQKYPKIGMVLELDQEERKLKEMYDTSLLKRIYSYYTKHGAPIPYTRLPLSNQLSRLNDPEGEYSEDDRNLMRELYNTIIRTAALRVIIEGKEWKDIYSLIVSTNDDTVKITREDIPDLWDLLIQRLIYLTDEAEKTATAEYKRMEENYKETIRRLSDTRSTLSALQAIQFPTVESVTLATPATVSGVIEE